MKCQIVFSGKKKKIIISLLSTEFSWRVVKVKLNALRQFVLNERMLTIMNLDCMGCGSLETLRW